MEVVLLSRGHGGHEKRRVRGERIMNSLGERRGGRWYTYGVHRDE